MLEVVLPILGGLGIAGTATGAAVYINQGPSWLPAARRWEKDFFFHREALVQMVSDTYEGTFAEALNQQIKTLKYGAKPLRGYEGTDEFLTPMALTSVMSVDEYDDTVEWIAPFHERVHSFSVNTRYALDKYLDPLEELVALLGASFVGLNDNHPAKEAVASFVREHAAHLLLNYRTSPREKKVFSRDQIAKSMLRQRRLRKSLDKTIEKVEKAKQNILVIKGYDAVAEAKALVSAEKSSSKGKKVAKEIEVAPAPDQSKPDPTLAYGNQAALTDEEKAVIALYDSRKRTLPDEDRRIAQGLIQKMYSAVELAVKAESFSTAARDKAVTLANQNRIYASNELEELLQAHDGLTAEEAEAIHALRLDNKYLEARNGEKRTQKEITNV